MPNTRNVSMGHRCPHISTFVTKLNFFRQTDGRTRANLNVHPLRVGHKNMNVYCSDIFT